MIRVLHVVERMGYGGIETFLMNIYRNIDRNQIQFDFAVYAKEKGEYDDEIRKLGGNIYYFNSRRDGIINYYKSWDRFLKENYRNYTTIHMHVSSLTTIIPIKVAKKYNIKNRIIHAHNTYQAGTIHNILNKLHQINIMKYATKLFACSTEAGEYVFGKNKFKIIKNGIKAEEYTFDEKKRLEEREKLNIKKGQLAIIHIGRFSEQKNHKFLIKIFKEFNEIESNSKLYLIGIGELKDKIESEIKQMNLNDKVVFLGTRDDVPQVLQAMDVFLFPSNYEGLGIVAIEAQASGIQCFISDKVPKEVMITDLVNYISLNKNEKEWAQILKERININQRRNTYKEVLNNGYDIKNTSKILIKYYLNY